MSAETGWSLLCQMLIQDQVFLITGGASGLGAATARHIVSLAGKVLIADIADEAGRALAASLGPNAAFTHCDVCSESDGQKAIDTARTLGPLRGLINCAGIASAEKTVHQNGPHALDTFVRAVQINLIGTFNMIRLAAHAMCAQAPMADQERGVIINTASIAAFEGQMGQAAYAASKGGIVSMTLPIARDLARSGIRCVTLAPGIFETPLMADMPTKVKKTLSAQLLFPVRFGQPSEYAIMVQAAIENVMLNGTCVRMDGAVRMQA